MGNDGDDGRMIFLQKISTFDQLSCSSFLLFDELSFVSFGQLFQT
jgi:hypothetical protein